MHNKRLSRHAFWLLKALLVRLNSSSVVLFEIQLAGGTEDKITSK